MPFWAVRVVCADRFCRLCIVLLRAEMIAEAISITSGDLFTHSDARPSPRISGIAQRTQAGDQEVSSMRRRYRWPCRMATRAISFGGRLHGEQHQRPLLASAPWRRAILRSSLNGRRLA
ncbi:hypothetical protein RPD_2369 [Rhodopseudomonas palustris BisB5]|uniref:Uncharacterized protein n=1 Tax=Rhodopseudomonas palustris (strain BisB5) TaxID=316057 RepID=Q137Y8_RHOPS|nr:hypothetical protein RPD_2369 [Rhodopseudomonas palustris BisB5]